MKLQPLYDLQQEINRLFIAGSKFAKGDPRLAKQIPVFNKLGEKAPVFKKLATDIEDLINCDVQQSAEKLSAISILLYSILYTQGETIEEGVETKPLQPLFDINKVKTDFSYLQLKPVMEALTTSNQGRLEVLKDAYKQSVFNDFRTYRYLDLALSDKYGELVNYIEETIIPSVGIAIIPFILTSFTYDDRPENVRRLKLLDKLGYNKIGEMCAKILSESLPNMQAEVVNIYSNDIANEELIIKLTDDKNKTVREASYMALAKYGTQACLEKLKDALVSSKRKTDIQIVIQALSSTKMPFFFKEVFNEVNLAFKEFISLGKDAEDKKITAALENLNTKLQLLENKDYPEVYTFLADILTSKEYNALISAKKALLGYMVSDNTRTIISCFDTLDPHKTLESYISIVKIMPNTDWTFPVWSAYFNACVNAGCTKEKIYDTFSDLYQKGMIATHQLYSYITERDSHFNLINIHADRLDVRWTDLIYKTFEGKLKWNYVFSESLLILNAIEPKNSKRFNNLLIFLSKNLEPRDVIDVFKMIIEREISDRFELIYSVVSQYKKSTASYYFYAVGHADYWSKFPKEYAPKFRELYDKQKLDIFNEIADKIENQ